MAKIVPINQGSPATVKDKVSKGPVAYRPKNEEVRTREHLYLSEVESMMKAAKGVGRHGLRDSTLILTTFRHGFRCSEVASLLWEQVDLTNHLMHIKRRKNGTPSTHFIEGKELRALKRLRRAYPGARFVFTTERKGPLSNQAIRHVVKRSGVLAKLPFPVHPHMLRNGAGYYLAERGQDLRVIQTFLGHRNVQNTTIYVQLSPQRFAKLWDD